MRILVADKEPSLRMLVSTRLSMRGYEVSEAGTSEEALRLLARDNYDLILLSDEMERIADKMLIEKIREHAHLLNLPIILMTEETNIAELVMSKERGFDDFLTKPFNPLVLQLRVSMNIEKIKSRVEANALTHLPGNHAIEHVIREKIDKREKFSVLYIDVNHFKSFNDRYGFEKGDDVIRQTAKILNQTRDSLSLEDRCFVGHIGGDDFVIVLPPEHEENYARAFINEFDRIIPTYYSEADRKRGGVRVKNRQGKQQTFPIMSCSVAACNNLYRDYRNLGEIAQDTAEVKSFLKSQMGSHYLRDRRSSPLKGAEEALHVLSPEFKPSFSKPKPAGEDVDPLGQVLLSAGLITQEQLSIALKKHLQTGRRLGQVLITMNAVKSEDVGRMLEKKLCVPYMGLRHFTMPREMFRYFTVDFIKSRRVIPLGLAGEQLKLGMCDPFDLHTLDAIEQITGMKPVPCLILEDEFEQFVERYTEHFITQENAG